MELELATSVPSGLDKLPRSNVPSPMSRMLPRSKQALLSSMLSAAVQEMLTAEKGKAAKKQPPRRPKRLLPASSSTESSRSGRTVSEDRNGKATVEPPEKRMARKRRTPEKRVARCLLKRSNAPPTDDRKVVLTCCCSRIPRGLRCALHQDGAPGRSWMCVDGGAVEEAVAPRACRQGGRVFGEYVRWRRSVWMPTRFYLEQVDQISVRCP